MTQELRTDVLIVGDGLGGCAAAVAVCRSGLHAILTKPTDWIGEQLTSQAVPPEEHSWLEQLGCTASCRRLRNMVRKYHRDQYPLTDATPPFQISPGATIPTRVENLLLTAKDLGVTRIPACVAFSGIHDESIVETSQSFRAQLKCSSKKPKE